MCQRAEIVLLDEQHAPQPRPAASRARPAPLMPPPMMAKVVVNMGFKIYRQIRVIPRAEWAALCGVLKNRARESLPGPKIRPRLQNRLCLVYQAYVVTVAGVTIAEDKTPPF